MTEQEEIVRKGYDEIAARYHADRHIFDNRKELEQFALLLPRPARVLDAGCGTGVPVARLLVDSGFEVVGVDFSESMLELARRSVPEAQLVKGDMTGLGFRDSSFDGLTAIYSIIHVPRQKHNSLFHQFHQMLKPDGVMLMCIGLDAWEGTDEYYGTRMFWSHYRSDQSLKLVNEAGFRVIFAKLLVRGGEKQYWVLARNVKRKG